MSVEELVGSLLGLRHGHEPLGFDPSTGVTVGGVAIVGVVRVGVVVAVVANGDAVDAGVVGVVGVGVVGRGTVSRTCTVVGIGAVATATTSGVGGRIWPCRRARCDVHLLRTVAHLARRANGRERPWRRGSVHGDAGIVDVVAIVVVTATAVVAAMAPAGIVGVVVVGLASVGAAAVVVTTDAVAI